MSRYGQLWPLVRVAEEAGVGRGTARSAVARGMLPPGGYGPESVVLLKVAAACLAFPDPDDPPAPKGTPEARPGRRDSTALRFARACLADPATTPQTHLLLHGADVDVADDAADLARLLARPSSQASLVLPLGRWITDLGTARSTPSPALPYSA